MTTLEQAHSRSVPAKPATSPHAPSRTQRLAFLLSRYPAVSHTFLLQEVLGLRARGFSVETASINRPDRPIEKLPTLEAIEAKGTHYIKDGRWFQALFTTLTTAIANPAVTLRGLRTVIRLPGLTLRERAFWLLYLAEALLLGRWMRERDLHHLHVHFGGAVASVGMLTSIAWQVPYSLTIHGPEELLDVHAYQLRHKLDQASFVFCISDFCRSQLCQLTPPSVWHKYTVIRLGIDPAVLTPPHRSAEHSSKRALRLVCTGRLVAAKGHRILLEALAALLDRNIFLDVTLIGDGPERPALEAFVTRNGLADFVTFTGPLSHTETLHHVRAADIFVLASFAEGIPVALMEAMAFAVPCVSTTIAGIPELIRNGLDGILVAPANVAELADALESLANDPSLRHFLGGSARQRIIRDYNLPLNHERLARCFAEQLTALHAKVPA